MEDKLEPDLTNLMKFREQVMANLTPREKESLNRYGEITKSYQKNEHIVILKIKPDQVSLFSSEPLGNFKWNEARCIFKADEIIVNHKNKVRYRADEDEVENEKNYYIAINNGIIGEIKQRSKREENGKVKGVNDSSVSSDKTNSVISTILPTLNKDFALIAKENLSSVSDYMISAEKILHPSQVVTKEVSKTPSISEQVRPPLPPDKIQTPTSEQAATRKALPTNIQTNPALAEREKGGIATPKTKNENKKEERASENFQGVQQPQRIRKPTYEEQIQDKIKEFSKSDKIFRQVLAGKISTYDYFTNEKFNDSKNKFMEIYIERFHERPESSLYRDENVAAAWITKLRFNEEMTDEQFINYINRSDKIFKGDFTELQLRGTKSENNDLCAIMWGTEALNGIQSFDSGATRVRLPEGVAPKIVKALEDGGSVPRESTHAQCTKLVAQGLGKDIENENLRRWTPRGKGTLLVIPTSQDGTGTVAKVQLGERGKKGKISTSLGQNQKYDLLFKLEPHGFRDKALHQWAHYKVGFVNRLTKNKEQYKIGNRLIDKKSFLVREAEIEFPKGKKVHRKDHLSELKKQSATLVSLLRAGKKMSPDLFPDFKTEWKARIKIPPWEIKIVSSTPDGRKGLGSFLVELEKASGNKEFSDTNQQKLKSVKDLLTQAKTSEPGDQLGDFKQCREGNEVLTNCSSGKAILVDHIAKNTRDTPVHRPDLVKLGMATETPPKDEAELGAAAKQKRYKGDIAKLWEDDTPPSGLGLKQ